MSNEILYFNCSGRQNIQTGNYGLTCKKVNRRSNPPLVQGQPVLGQTVVQGQTVVPGTVPIVYGTVPIVRGTVPVVQGTVPVVNQKTPQQLAAEKRLNKYQIRAANQMPFLSLLTGRIGGGNTNNKKSRKLLKGIKTMKRRKNKKIKKGRRKTRK
jgi:hypothetical protein